MKATADYISTTCPKCECLVKAFHKDSYEFERDLYTDIAHVYQCMSCESDIVIRSAECKDGFNGTPHAVLQPIEYGGFNLQQKVALAKVASALNRMIKESKHD